MQSQRHVFSIRSNRFLKYKLDLMIRHINLTTSLRVIGDSYFVSRRILSKQSLKRSMTKMTTSITNKSSRGTIQTENTLFHKLNHNLVFIGPSSLSFHALWHITNSNQYILYTQNQTMGEGTYEINAPHIKYLNNHNQRKGHHITTRQGTCEHWQRSQETQNQWALKNRVGQKNPLCRTLAAVLWPPKWSPQA